MNCNEIRERMPDLVLGMDAATPELHQHLQTCRECAARMAEVRQTMVLLDEWAAPEPSPYFDVRLRARVREEAASAPAGWMQWFRKPALAVSLAVLMVASVTFFRGGNDGRSGNVPEVLAIAEPGSAVGDLQNLDKNHELLYSDFDVLDELQVQPEVNQNP
jgi:hypothetical protein